MGFTPDQIDAMSFWQFLAVRDGYITANSLPDKIQPPSPEQHDAMLEKYG